MDWSIRSFFIKISLFIGKSFSLYTEFTVDYKIGVIIIKTKKICCFSKSKVIEINKIQRVFIKNDFNTTFKL